MRCPSGSGWGEAPVAGRFRAAPAPPTSRTCATPDGRRRAAKAGRPLARETSAGGAQCFGWVANGASALLGALGPPGPNEARASSPGSGGLHGGWLQPHQEVFLPVQRKLGAPRGRARSGDRSILWLCSWIVLVAEVDERHLVQVSHRVGKPPREALGLATYGACLAHGLGVGEGVSEAGSRRQSREHGGGLSMILRLFGGRQGREHSSREGVLGSRKQSSLTRRQRRRRLAVPPGRPGRKAGSARRDRDRGRQRLRRKLGWRLKTPQPGGAARRSIRSKLRQDRAASRSQVGVASGATRTRSTRTGCDKAEAGGSPSSEASPGGSPEAIGRG